MNQTIDIQVNENSIGTTEDAIQLVIKNDFLPAIDHIVVRISTEGIVIERLDVANNRYVNAYCVVFAQDFNGDGLYVDELE